MRKSENKTVGIWITKAATGFQVSSIFIQTQNTISPLYDAGTLRNCLRSKQQQCLRALGASRYSWRHSSFTQAYVSITFKACARNTTWALMRSPPCLGLPLALTWEGMPRIESIITSATASLCKLCLLNYSSLAYLSARSRCVVEGF